mmetsp:Transcript_8943/g.17503  ORF Transcript_8943/g.17503 Transcript_8943/m.17503 type:complete len:209 (+) Transcript_8943:117-743(+)
MMAARAVTVNTGTTRTSCALLYAGLGSSIFCRLLPGSASSSSLSASGGGGADPPAGLKCRWAGPRRSRSCASAWALASFSLSLASLSVACWSWFVSSSFTLPMAACSSRRQSSSTCRSAPTICDAISTSSGLRSGGAGSESAGGVKKCGGRAAICAESFSDSRMCSPSRTRTSPSDATEVGMVLSVPLDGARGRGVEAGVVSSAGGGW